MKSYFLLTDTGLKVILTSYDSVEHPALLRKFQSEGIEKFIQKIRDLSREIGEPSSLKEAGITKEQINNEMDTLVHLGSTDPNMYTIPCECKEEDLRQLFQSLWAGKGAS